VRYRLAIFDFDGTLADSAGWFAGVYNDIAARFRLRQLDAAGLAALRELDNRAIIRALDVPMWKLPLIARHTRALAADHAHRIALFPGAADLLGRLHTAGVRLAVVSSNAEANVRRVLGPETAALIGHYGCGAGLFGKAARFRRAARRAGVTPGEVLCIGDEARDIEAAARAGMASAAVAWGYAAPTLLKRQGPTLFFDRLDEIEAAFGISNETVAYSQRAG
jgi:phosphoglycolate phosphatase